MMPSRGSLFFTVFTHGADIHALSGVCDHFFPSSGGMSVFTMTSGNVYALWLHLTSTFTTPHTFRAYSEHMQSLVLVEFSLQIFSCSWNHFGITAAIAPASTLISSFTSLMKMLFFRGGTGINCTSVHRMRNLSSLSSSFHKAPFQLTPSVCLLLLALTLFLLCHAHNSVCKLFRGDLFLHIRCSCCLSSGSSHGHGWFWDNANREHSVLLVVWLPCERKHVHSWECFFLLSRFQTGDQFSSSCQHQVLNCQALLLGDCVV